MSGAIRVQIDTSGQSARICPIFKALALRRLYRHFNISYRFSIILCFGYKVGINDSHQLFGQSRKNV
jgi:hypothetical protein